MRIERTLQICIIALILLHTLKIDAKLYNLLRNFVFPTVTTVIAKSTPVPVENPHMWKSHKEAEPPLLSASMSFEFLGRGGVPIVNRGTW